MTLIKVILHKFQLLIFFYSIKWYALTPLTSCFEKKNPRSLTSVECSNHHLLTRTCDFVMLISQAINLLIDLQLINFPIVVSTLSLCLMKTEINFRYHKDVNY